MNTRSVGQATIWALLAMEIGLVLPLISLPAQGQTRPGPLGGLVLVLLLPAGFIATRLYPALRDPSWRLPVGIALALAARAVVSAVPADADSPMRGLAAWLTMAFVPAAIGIALWWRGAVLSVSELTASEVRTEFAVVAVILLAVLAVLRPFVLAEPLLLVGAVGLFAVGGAVATALSRQDAAEASARRAARTLASGLAVLPLLLAGLLVGVLRPSLLGVFWELLARAVELLLTPLGWLAAWLASLFPRVSPGPIVPPPRPAPLPTPDPRLVAELQEQNAWLATAVLIGMLLVLAVFVLVIVKLMLDHWLMVPSAVEPRAEADLAVEASGTARGDVGAVWAWLMRWLRGRVGHRGQAVTVNRRAADARRVSDTWAAYQLLLEWAARRGIRRAPAETTGQLQQRLLRESPAAEEPVAVVTRGFEQERYGERPPDAAALRQVQAALRSLDESN